MSTHAPQSFDAETTKPRHRGTGRGWDERAPWLSALASDPVVAIPLSAILTDDEAAKVSR